MSIEEEVDRLIDERTGRELLNVPYDEAAVQIHDRIYRSAGATASYLIDAGDARVVVNTGMGFEAPHHKKLFGAIHTGPTDYIITTQGHVDHVGGVSQFREKQTRYVAQRNNPRCQADDKRIQSFRQATALTWFPELPEKIGNLTRKYPDAKPVQDIPTPDILFDAQMKIHTGDLAIELIHAPGGETIDSTIVWIPEWRVAITSNLFGPLFPHFPNFNTLRGDLYRFPVPYMENIDRVRALNPATLITGRGLPIEGADLIDASLARMRGAVDFVHQRTLELINQQKDPYEIMRSVELPRELRVGQGYGKVSWAARTIFEEYTGWFQRRSTADLYPVDPALATATLAAELGSKAVMDRAQQAFESGDVPTAIRLAEAILAQEDHLEAKKLMAASHQKLLETGSESFWEHGWLRAEAKRWNAETES
ncbi:MAG: alkyl sulfatase dimerization domain-containing protein [Myxococcota bacterium]|nr:alkyl sulfatase dimerization domain-containing protein [Myxococcota bacterium]